MTSAKSEVRELPSIVVAFDHDAAAQAVGISPTRLRQHVRMGDLTPHFSGTKPLYLVTDLARFVEHLPTRPDHLPLA